MTSGTSPSPTNGDGTGVDVKNPLGAEVIFCFGVVQLYGLVRLKLLQKLSFEVDAVNETLLLIALTSGPARVSSTPRVEFPVPVSRLMGSQNVSCWVVPEYAVAAPAVYVNEPTEPFLLLVIKSACENVTLTLLNVPAAPLVEAV